MLRGFTLIFFWTGLATAQQTVNNAALGGRVTDSSGAIVQGAEVAARQVVTNITAVQKTNRENKAILNWAAPQAGTSAESSHVCPESCRGDRAHRKMAGTQTRRFTILHPYR
jgi:hypothetical protein